MEQLLVASLCVNVFLFLMWRSSVSWSKFMEEDADWWQKQCLRLTEEADKYFRWWLETFK